MDLAEIKDKLATICRLLVRLDFSGLKRLLRVNSLFEERNIVGNFVDMRAMFFHTNIPAITDSPHPLPENSQRLPDSYSHGGEVFSLAKWQSDVAVCSMVVLKAGKIAYQDYFHGTKAGDRRISWSMSKSVLSATMGVLKDQGALPHFATRIGDIVPALRNSAYGEATLRNVLNMASGVAFNEDYLDYHSDINRMGRVLAVGGSMDQFAIDMKAQAWTPGQYSHYVSIDTHVLGMVMRVVTGRRLDDLIRELLFDPMGLEHNPYILTDSVNEPFVLGGLNMSTRDYARFGLLFAQGGQLGGRQIISQD
ncbi:MAG: serine hydrolase, partial [Rhodobacteraceae bacterium]|nr:serine hydrolase [Paracoccaceae bacterium]